MIHSRDRFIPVTYKRLLYTTQQTNGLGIAWDIRGYSRIQSIISRIDPNLWNKPGSGLGHIPRLTQS